MVEFEGQQFRNRAQWARAFPAYRSYEDVMRDHAPKTIQELEKLIAARNAPGRQRSLHAARTGKYSATNSKIARAGQERKQP